MTYQSKGLEATRSIHSLPIVFSFFSELALNAKGLDKITFSNASPAHMQIL